MALGFNYYSRLWYSFEAWSWQLISVSKVSPLVHLIISMLSIFLLPDEQVNGWGAIVLASLVRIVKHGSACEDLLLLSIPCISHAVGASCF